MFRSFLAAFSVCQNTRLRAAAAAFGNQSCSRKLAAVSGNYFLEDRLYVYKRAVLMKEHIDEFINFLGLFQMGQMFGLRNFECFDGRIAKCIFLDDLVDVKFLSAAKNVNTVVDLLQGRTDPAFGIIADHAGIDGLG